MTPTRLNIVAALVIWLSAGLQQGLAFRLSVIGAQPNFIFVSACILGLLVTTRTALVIGFILGVAESAIVGSDMWQFALTRMFACWICAYLIESRFQRNGGVASLAALICTVVSGLIFLIIAPQPNIMGTVKATIITALYNAVLALLAYYPIEKAAGVNSQQL